MGYAVVISGRSGIVATAVAALGVLSGFLDFVENSIRSSLASAISERTTVDPNWGVAWDVVVGLSFWAILIPAVLASLSI
jgi:hypothetical protein